MEMNSTKALSLSGFGFAYPDGPAVFEHVDWECEQGSFTLLVGGTGSGKTTLLRLLKPEIAPTGTQSGTCVAFGKSLDAWSVFDSASGIGYVAQSPENQMVCDTVWHELAFGLENLGTDQDAMRRRVAEVAHFFGIEPWVRRSVHELSGGQKQMVNLAGVLAMQPKLLLLDEPTAQLDPVAEKNFLHALFRINRELGITVVVATHAPETMVDYATACVQLREGRLEKTPLSTFRYGFGVSAEELQEPVNCDDAFSGIVPSRTRGDRSEAIGFSDVFFRYDRGGDWVMRGLDATVEEGSVHAVVGGNGSGKSTLLRLAAKVLRPERGRARNAFIEEQAFLPQDPKALFVCDTVEEELREWQERCGYTNDELTEMMERLGFSQLGARHPYDLSGGQQQKLACAKVLLTKPRLLLLDEPTKGLDAPSKCEVASLLRMAAQQKTTVVFVTHDLMFASKVADRVSMVFDGECVCSEPAPRFFERNLFYRPMEDAFSLLWRKGNGSGSGQGGEEVAACSAF